MTARVDATALQVIADTEWHTVRDICRILDVHPNTVYTWIRTGELTSAKTGTTRRAHHVSGGELADFLRARMVTL